MDADDLAAVDRMLAGNVTTPGWISLDVVRALRAHIGALQAENERLRNRPGSHLLDFYDPELHCLAPIAHIKAMEACVTLLEGLLARSREGIEHSWQFEHGYKASATGPPVVTERNATCLACCIDAALSRSDQNTSDDAT